MGGAVTTAAGRVRNWRLVLCFAVAVGVTPISVAAGFSSAAIAEVDVATPSEATQHTADRNETTTRR
jgi:hypothetical protein